MILVLYVDRRYGECHEDIFTDEEFAKVYMFDDHIQVLCTQDLKHA